MHHTTSKPNSSHSLARRISSATAWPSVILAYPSVVQKIRCPTSTRTLHASRPPSGSAPSRYAGGVDQATDGALSLGPKASRPPSELIAGCRLWQAASPYQCRRSVPSETGEGGRWCTWRTPGSRPGWWAEGAQELPGDFAVGGVNQLELLVPNDSGARRAAGAAAPREPLRPDATHRRRRTRTD